MHDKLLKIQQTLKAPKNQTNAFGKYKYRSCEDILEAVKPLLAEQGLTLTLSDRIVSVGGRNYIEATASLFDPQENQVFQSNDGVISGSISDMSGTIMPISRRHGMAIVTAYAREEETKKGMDGAQITGSASSYARKYALNGLFLIDDTKDSDATNDHGKDAKEVAKTIPLAEEEEEEDISFD